MNLFHWFKRAKVPPPCTCDTTYKTGLDCPLHGAIKREARVDFLIKKLRTTLNDCEKELDRQGL